MSTENPEENYTEKLQNIASHGFENAARGFSGMIGQKLQVVDSTVRSIPLQEIIDAQGRKKVVLEPGKFTADIKAFKNGTVSYINNKMVSHYARLAGAPLNSGAGLFIRKFIGDKVKKGDALFTVHAENKSRLENTVQLINVADCYQIKS